MIDTERLHLRPWRADELDASHGLTADEESRRFLSAAARREDSYKRLMMAVGGWAAHGYSTFAVEERGSGQVVGSCGLFRMVRTLDTDAEPEEIEAGWIVGRRWWGQGYAGEAARAAHAWFDRTHGPRRTVCMIAPGNLASERIAADLGYRAYRDERHLGDAVTLYERTP